MAPLKTFNVAGNPAVNAVPLTPESFAEFGGVLSADHQISTSASSSANYGTAVKIFKASPITNRYAEAPSGTPATANWNIFRCSPPAHLISWDGPKSLSGTYTAKVLERHPFSTQTFVPMGRDKVSTGYLVIVARTGSDGLPDPNTVTAFIAKGNQAVTYGVGTWHAPMVALVDMLDFAVLIHENGVADEDCQECYFEPGFSVKFGLQQGEEPHL